ncbi:hypothetical protein N836_34840 [Leptolyngbya sp. Heron Island J]|uniref:hypothetical protein n=1 Tax=Leptolyngbya sp. Heron Island J TaxID=1385935 RepID=UPI0003B981AC|nr:hypothetical protein [Leptolyngbya sp. Heron Island J]ESA37802.1 hypothetical protein N836_34840 [Leptolyngbya sp. Heron Island J]
MVSSELGREAQQAITLIKSFSLELEQYSPESQVLYWLHQYRAPWIRDAIIEAVYQGRYKIISVEHILAIWQRRGQPVCHFTSGFEQVISAQLGTQLRLSTSMMTQMPQPARDIEKLDTRDISLSLISQDELPPPTNIEFADSTMGYGDLSGLSIKAFPVKAEDTLVEVYQASTSRRESADKSSHPVNASSNRDKNAKNTSGHVYLTESSPIQPFQPTLRSKRLARH